MQIFVKTLDTQLASAWWCADLCLHSRMQIFIVLTPFFVPPSYLLLLAIHILIQDKFTNVYEVPLRGGMQIFVKTSTIDTKLCISMMACRSSSR